MAEILQNSEFKRNGPPPPAAGAAASAPASLTASDDFDRKVWCLLGIPVDAVDIDRALAMIDAAARERRPLSFVTPNVNWLVRALRSPEARREILNADLSLIDGAPLVAVAKLLGTPIKGRVAGSDLFEALRRRAPFGGRRLKVFFFGGREGAAEAAATALDRERGGLEAAGWLNPGFGDVESMSAPAVIEDINRAGADFLVVALGAGKGQAWIDRNRSRLAAPVVAHLGAVIDFTGGGVARAPAPFRRLGMEWIWRIMAEPALWRRYAKDAAALATLVLPRLAALLARRERGQAQNTARVARREAGGAHMIELEGDLTAPNLAEARSAFRKAAQQGVDVVIDLAGVSSMDLAFLGLVLMLEKHVAHAGRDLFVNGASRRQLAFLRANAMSYRPHAPAGVVLRSGEAAA